MRILRSARYPCLDASLTRSVGAILALLVVLACALQPGFGQEKSLKHRITVKDTIEMTEFADRGYFLGGDPDSPVASFSPDGEQFLIRLKKGDVEHNVVDYWLLLFRTSEASRSPRGRVLVTMSSSSNREAIQKVRWLDNRSVLFLGENAGGIPQVYRLDMPTGRLTQLTHHPTPVVSYDASRDGREIVYEAVPPRKNVIETEEVRRNGWLISSQDVDELIRAEQEVREDLTVDRELYVQSGEETPVQIHSPDFLSEYLFLTMSPDGRYAVTEAYVSSIPERWAEYEDKVLHPYIVERRKPGSMSNVLQYMLLDVRKGTLRPLLEAPKAWLDGGIAWLYDGRSVAVSGTYLPLNPLDKEAQKERRAHPYVIEVDVLSGEIHEITGDALRIANGDEKAHRITLVPGYGVKKGPPRTFEKIDKHWQASPAPSPEDSEKSRVEVTLEESKNVSPRIFVTDRSIGRKALLLDLNPQFRDFAFGNVETFKWQAIDGHEVEGGLYYPPDYRAGKRYPLVIQTHGFEEGRFWMNGPWNSAFAAQPLAAQGIMVLQVGNSTEQGADRSFINTVREGPRRMAAFEGAVDELDRRGLIDKDRVGLIGFSRTAFHVAFTLTHSKYRFRAATIADGFEGGYLSYLVWGGADSVGVNGVEPIGTGLNSWLERAPAFNLDKVSTPVRIENYGPRSYLGSWEWYSVLTRLGKPVDFIWIPQGTHLLVKPWDRLTSQQGNVDWFRFWLFGNTCGGTENGTCARWRELASLTTQRPKNLTH
jgi:dipeptidyl aminopeptidase/acylaminoacyl peptidase